MISTKTGFVNVENLAELITEREGIATSCIVPFADGTEFLSDLLRLISQPNSRLYSAGHVTPSVAIAADRAEVPLTEIISESPFSVNITGVLAQVTEGNEIVYIANPNRITGASCGLKDIERLLEAVPCGACIVDEFYTAHLGLTVSELTDRYNNLIILRSFTSGFGIHSADAGYALASETTASSLRHSITGKNISPTVRKIIMAAMINEDALEYRLKQTRDEALRVTKSLTALGVQCRINPTDFLLLRVASTKEVGNHLNRFKATVENLDGYPGLDNYLKFRVESPLSNDRLIAAFEKAPTEMYRLRTLDRRAATLPGSGEAAPSARPAETVDPISEMMLARLKDRQTSPTIAKKDRETVSSSKV